MNELKPLFSVSAKIRDSLLIAGSAAALTCGLGGAALAGNLEEPVVEAPIFTPAPAEPAPSWAGFYLGGSIGYDFQGDDEVGHRSAATGTIVASPDTLKQHGFNYGLHAGWRGERALSERTAVYGLEFGYMGGKADDDFTTDGYTASTDLNYVLGLRGKAGVTNRSGDTLFYGILGFVRGDFDYSVQGGGADPIALDTSYSSNGFAAGVGVERKLSENWSVRAEYEYLQFQKKDLTDAGGASTKATPKFHNVQLGVNFRF